MSNASYTPPQMTDLYMKEGCIHSRRCFMSGEHCSKQLNIYKERKRLHNKEEPQINAFVIMNFSDMSDVVYKWRLNDFVKSLSNFFYINKDTESVICSLTNPGEKWEQVKKINILRSDSNPASNYVVCNRICQQLQIADLIIVDVTNENTNVFYEFGMAMAMNKLILPICYNDSFYFSKVPGNNDREMRVGGLKLKREKHIGCFAWRKRLFEYFGLRYRNSDSVVQYFPYKNAIEEIKDEEDARNFRGDIDYKSFPFHQKVSIVTSKDSSHVEKVKIGEKIYNTLANSYNNDKGTMNTIVVYTMDGFGDAREAAQSIINFYEHMTSQIKKMHTFCGDRVLTLVQENTVKEDAKDAKENVYLPYKVGDLIHIGVNQATYVAQRDKIVTSDFLNTTDDSIGEEDKKEIIKSVKQHIGNKSLVIPLNPPIFVDQVKNGLQRESFIMDDPDGLEHYFCFFHIMLRILRYANEIVVDISNNCIEALFWLGIAHGADVHAITVRYDNTEIQKSPVPDNTHKERNIFDVAGLWTAILKTHDTEGFYSQLALAQTSIEQHSKLMLNNSEIYAELMLDCLREAPYISSAQGNMHKIIVKKREEEELKLESYYRDRFWTRMTHQNHLHLYMSQKPSDPQARHQLLIAKWDVDAISALSHYLSKRKIISESYIEALSKTSAPREYTNFISIGADMVPYIRDDERISLIECINRQIDRDAPSCQKVRILNSVDKQEPRVNCVLSNKEIRCRGFDSYGNDLYTLLPNPECFTCRYAESSEEHPIEFVFDKIPFPVNICPFPKKDKNPRHTQLAQMLLWRERPASEEESIKFQISLIGASGPATYALTSILVDEPQKEKIIQGESQNNKHLLSVLQYEIRKDFIGKYLNVLKELNVSSSKTEKILDANQVCSIELYLSTVLYRYFFPFLSREDEYRICNGLTAYLTVLKKEKGEDWRFVNEETIVDTLRDKLQKFRGVEAMYAVDVEVKSGNTDDREILAIQPLSALKTDSVNINCIYGDFEPLNQGDLDMEG